MQDLQQIGLRLRQAVSNFRWSIQSISIALLIVLGLAALMAVQSEPTTQREPLFVTPLSSSNLQQIEAALGKTEFIDYVIQDGMLLVPARKRAMYLSAISDAKAMPESFYDPSEQALNGGSLIETSQQRSQRWHSAIEQETRLAICSMAGIEDAFVRFDETSRGFRDQRIASAAAVVKTSPDRPLDLQGFRIIQNTLLGLNAALTVDGITITDLTASRSIRGAMSDNVAVVTAMVREGLERQWREKLSAMLGNIPGLQLTVQVTPNGDIENPTAEAVQVSVGVPSTFIDQLARDPSTRSNDMNREQIEQQTRQQIQRSLATALPTTESPGNGDRIVSVYVIPTLTPEAGPGTEWRNLSNSPWFAILTVLGITVSGLLLFVSNNRHSEPVHEEEQANGQPPSLRVVSSDDPIHDRTVVAGTTVAGTTVAGSRAGGSAASHATGDESEQTAESLLQSQLRAYVEEDPDAAAKSLSEFIDRAS